MRKQRWTYSFLLVLLSYLSQVVRANATLDPYDRTKDIRPNTINELMNGRSNWGADVAFGFGISTGNSNFTTINFEMNSFKKFENFAASILGNIYYMNSNGILIRNQGLGVARMDYRFTDHLRVFAATTHAYNQYIQLVYRGTIESGLLIPINFGPIKSGFSLAPTFEYENYLMEVKRNTFRLSFRYLALVQITDTAALSLDSFYVPSISDWDDFRAFCSISITNKIYKTFLSLRLAYSIEYFSAPIQGVLPTDTNYTTSLIIHLGQ